MASPSSLFNDEGLLLHAKDAAFRQHLAQSLPNTLGVHQDGLGRSITILTAPLSAEEADVEAASAAWLEHYVLVDVNIANLRDGFDTYLRQAFVADGRITIIERELVFAWCSGIIVYVRAQRR